MGFNTNIFGKEPKVFKPIKILGGRPPSTSNRKCRLFFYSHSLSDIKLSFGFMSRGLNRRALVQLALLLFQNQKIHELKKDKKKLCFDLLNTLGQNCMPFRCNQIEIGEQIFMSINWIFTRINKFCFCLICLFVYYVHHMLKK